MHYTERPRKQSRMAASREDPWISVSLLAENSYCPRAGIIQYESPKEDTGEEMFHAGRRTRRVFYSLQQIRRSLKRAAIFAAVMLLGALILYSLFTVIFAAHQNDDTTFMALWFCCILACFTCFIASLYNFLRFLFLLVLYWSAKLTSPSAPDPDHTVSQQVEWWSLINAGFQPVMPQDQYRDEHWHLVGHPWRVLVKGNLRIPVFKKRPNRGTAGEKLFRQHYARMAAYCHLIEKCENASSPYGIVLFGDSHQGLTVPCQPGTKKTFHDGLLHTRSTITNVQHHFIPTYPSNPQICVLCPHSRRDYATGLSACGTRFGWIPPNYKDAYNY